MLSEGRYSKTPPKLMGHQLWMSPLVDGYLPHGRTLFYRPLQAFCELWMDLYPHSTMIKIRTRIYRLLQWLPNLRSRYPRRHYTSLPLPRPLGLRPRHSIRWRIPLFLIFLIFLITLSPTLHIRPVFHIILKLNIDRFHVRSIKIRSSFDTIEA